MRFDIGWNWNVDVLVCLFVCLFVCLLGFLRLDFRTLGSGVRWTNLHPQKLLDSMKSFNFNFPFDTLDDFMKRVRWMEPILGPILIGLCFY